MYCVIKKKSIFNKRGERETCLPGMWEEVWLSFILESCSVNGQCYYPCSLRSHQRSLCFLISLSFPVPSTCFLFS